MEDQLKRLAGELGVRDAVEFLGFVEDERRNQLIEQADIAVFPSLYEPFGIVALEAMGLGTATVVSRTGGLAEIVEHGVDGWLVEPGDDRMLAGTILNILSDPEGARKVAARGRTKALTRYGWTGIAAGTMEVYREVIRKSGQPGAAESTKIG
jgi:glycosyltransferase involved in cell wall biosynthesis